MGAPPGMRGGVRGGGETKLHRSPKGVRTPAASNGANIVRELTVALAQSHAARLLHCGGSPALRRRRVRHGRDNRQREVVHATSLLLLNVALT